MPNLLALIQKGAAALVGEDQRSQGNHANLEGWTTDDGRPTVEAHGEEEGRISMTAAEFKGFVSRVEHQVTQRERDNAEAKLARERLRQEERHDAKEEAAAKRRHELDLKRIESDQNTNRRRGGWGWGREYRGNGYWNYKTIKLLAIASGVVALIIWANGERHPEHVVTEHVRIIHDDFGQARYVHEWY